MSAFEWSAFVVSRQFRFVGSIGSAAAHCLVASDVDLLGNFDRIIDFDTEIANSAFDAPVPSNSCTARRFPVRR